jgi:hypothetical protein
MEQDAALRAQRYRREAAEILTAVDEITDPDSRATLVRLAETYIRLAKQLDRVPPSGEP